MNTRELSAYTNSVGDSERRVFLNKIINSKTINKMYKIEFNYRYGKDRVFCSEYKVDNYCVYPLNKEGNPMCTISRTNIISITKDNKTT